MDEFDRLSGLLNSIWTQDGQNLVMEWTNINVPDQLDYLLASSQPHEDGNRAYFPKQ